MIVDESTYLAHYGVKGMRWGIRKDRYKSIHSTGVTLHKGQRIQNISFGGSRNLSGKSHVYASITNKDNEKYAGMHAATMILQMDQKSAFKNTLIMDKDIKIPSQEEAVNLFLELAKDYPQELATGIGKAYSDLIRTTGSSEKYAQKVNSNIVKTYSKAGYEWMQGEGYHTFNQVLVSSDEFKFKSRYVHALMNRGYGGIFDTNDINGAMNTDMPLVIFNPSTSMHVSSSAKMTGSDIGLALGKLLTDGDIPDKVGRQWAQAAKAWFEKQYR